MKKPDIYRKLFQWGPVKQYADRQGIEDATEDAAKHRCPFLLNILDAIGVISQSQSEIAVQLFLICKTTMQTEERETDAVIARKIALVKSAWKSMENELPNDEPYLLREGFGIDFQIEHCCLDEADTVT